MELGGLDSGLTVGSSLGVEEPPSAKRAAKGIAEVAVKTGKSVRFIGLGVDIGVPVFGGSHFSDSCWGTAVGAGPSGW